MKKIITALTFLFLSVIARAGDKPTFPGGEQALNKYLAEKVHYPAMAIDNGVEGIVVVGFIVNPDGSITNAKVIKFVDPDLEKEALRVVGGMPSWIPAEKEGVPIEAPAQVEVPFLLPD